MPSSDALHAELAQPAPATSGRGFKTCLWLHRWCGLISAPFFLVLCITGTLLIFHHELQTWLGELPVVNDYDSKRPIAVQRMLEQAKLRMPDRKPLYVLQDEKTPGLATLGMAPANDMSVAEAKSLMFHTNTGALLQDKDLMNDTFLGWVFDLHASWLMGTAGQFFGGFIGILVLISVLCGLAVYQPFVRRIAFGEVRRHKVSTTSQLDWHNFIGVIVTGWLLVVTLSGIFLSVGSIGLKIWRMTELQAMIQPYKDRPLPSSVVPIELAISNVSMAKPDARFMGAMFPGSEFSGDHHYGVFTGGKKAWDSKLFEITLVEAATGRALETRVTPWYLKVIMLSEPLHFGDYGGLPLQLFWTLATWLAMFITGNGAWLWWKKHARKMP